MKKNRIFGLIGMMLLAAMLIVTPALACEGPDCNAQGYLGVGVAAGNIGFDADGKIINNGAAGSIGVGAGGSAGLAAGYVNNGKVSATTSVVGGGASGATSHQGTLVDKEGNSINGPDFRSITVGSGAESVAQTGGSMDVFVDPAGTFIVDGFGLVGGAAGGAAGQGTLSGSGLILNDSYDSDGFSGGVAGQGSTGSWSGSAHAGSKGDIAKDKGTGEYTYEGGQDGGPGYYEKYKGGNKGKVQHFKNGHPPDPSEWRFLGQNRTEDTEHVINKDSKAGAGFEANIHMYGNTSTVSYRYIDTSVEGRKTEGLGTYVNAKTQVTSSGSSYANSTPLLANANASVNGSYKVAGGAASLTAQESIGQGSLGGAVAGAVGTYQGSGTLGCNFDGSATGFTATSVTTFDGMNGSINSASAGMEVTAQTNGGNVGGGNPE